jgi:hypothetical protein
MKLKSPGTRPELKPSVNGSQFMAVKKSKKKFKGVRREKKAA